MEQAAADEVPEGTDEYDGPDEPEEGWDFDE